MMLAISSLPTDGYHGFRPLTAEWTGASGGWLVVD